MYLYFNSFLIHYFWLIYICILTQVYVHTCNNRICNKNIKILSLIRISTYIYINYLSCCNIIFINVCLLYVKYYKNDFVLLNN